MADPASQPQLDPELTLDLCCAAIQCYNAYGAGDAFGPDPLKFVTPPPGWEYVDAWYGRDVFDKSPIAKLVVFGLAFRRTAAPGEVAFAFRGTEGVAEWWDDVQLEEDPFKPFDDSHGPPVPAGAKAEKGFSEIYYSMQQAVFALLDQTAPSQLWITGHSLGSSLAELFALDVALSRPNLAAATIDFASPRPGNADFAAFYASVVTSPATVRVVNVRDLVPHLPPEDLGFRAVGEQYSICFDRVGLGVPDLTLRHAADNYFRTLQHVFGTTDCDCRLSGTSRPELSFCSPS